MFQGWGSPRNSRSPRANRSPRASRTYFGFGTSKQSQEGDESQNSKVGEDSGKPSKRGSFLSGISQSIRSMSPRSARARSPRQQRDSTGNADTNSVGQKKSASSSSVGSETSKATATTTSAKPPLPSTTAPSKVTTKEVASKSNTTTTEEAKYLRPHLRVGDALNGRYEILHDISTGSFGHVIACKDIEQKGRTVAVKVQDRVEAKYHKGQSIR
jgi:hypothetical protein